MWSGEARVALRRRCGGTSLRDGPGSEGTGGDAMSWGVVGRGTTASPSGNQVASLSEPTIDARSLSNCSSLITSAVRFLPTTFAT